MKKNLLNSSSLPEENKDSLIAEEVLKHSLMQFQIEDLKKKIDQSLIERNKEEFLRLTNELKNIS